MWTWLVTWVVISLTVWLTLGDESNVTPWGAMWYAAAMASLLVPASFALYLSPGG